MFDWFRRIFRMSDADEHQRFFEYLDTLNAEAGGGKPTVTQRFLGNLKLRSGTLALGDPQYLPSLVVPNVATTEVGIYAKLLRYPSGTERITALTLTLGDDQSTGSRRKIGKVEIDSAKLVVADKTDVEEYWAAVGKDRIGVICTARDDAVLRMLTKRFKLKTVRVNRVRAEVVGPVSESLEKEIEGCLKSNPTYAAFPFIYFRVQTNDSFDRVNYMEKPWGFMPVGNADAPLMFACETGRGDGIYGVQCGFSGEVPQVVSIEFIDDRGE